MGAWFRFVAWGVVTAGGILYAVHALLLETWRVPKDDPMLAASIEPTLSAGDIVLVWRGASFARGNLLRCPDPQAPGRFVIARAIGAAGDHLAIEDERVSLDGRRTPSPYACAQVDYTLRVPGRDEDVDLACTVEEYGDRDYEALTGKDHLEPPTRVRVDEGRWFLVSDNRHIHVDSRDYGAIDAAPCRHIVFRLFGESGISDAKRRFALIW